LLVFVPVVPLLVPLALVRPLLVLVPFELLLSLPLPLVVLPPPVDCAMGAITTPCWSAPV
jgi:hypothetical protein